MKLPNRINFFKKVLPWILGLGILGYLFYIVDTVRFMEALVHADIFMYVPFLVIFIIISYFIDAQNFYEMLKKFGHRISYSDMLGIRGVSYLLMVINFSLGLGGVAYYLKREHHISIPRAASLMLFYTLVTKYSIYFMTIAGCLMVPVMDRVLERVFILCLIIFAVNTAVVMAIRYMPEWGILKKFKKSEILSIYFDTSISNFLTMVMWRILYYSTFVLFFYVGVRAFNMQIPLIILTAYVPVILFIISLPITPFGMGTVQAAMLVFFRDYGSPEVILAFGISYSASIIIGRGLLGMIFIKRAVRPLVIEESEAAARA